jgi:hypothetical protein
MASKTIYSSSDDFKEFPFANLKGGKPTLVSSNNYFIKYTIQDHPIYIQLPKCKSKQGIINVGKKYFIDFLLTSDNEDFITWIEALETFSIDYLYTNRSEWFEEEMEKEEIETYFVSPIRVFKSGKFYILRVPIASAMGKPVMKIYNEDEVEVSYDSINENTLLLSVLEFKGIKCSPRSFQLEIEAKQMMSMKPDEIFNQCIFRSSKPTESSSIENSVSTTTPQSLGEEMIQQIEEPQDVFVEDNHSDPDTNNSQEQQPILEENGDVPLLLTNEQTPEPELMELNITTDDLEKNDQLQNDLEEDTSLEKTSNSYGLEEVEDFASSIETQQPLQLKEKGELYYEMYGDAKRRAKMLKDMALSAYLEAKEIKQKYNLDDSDEDSSDEESNESDEEYEILEKL